MSKRGKHFVYVVRWTPGYKIRKQRTFVNLPTAEQHERDMRRVWGNATLKREPRP